MKPNLSPETAKRLFLVAVVFHVIVLVAAPFGVYETLFRDAYANSDVPGMDFYAIYQAGFNARHGISLHDLSTLTEQSGVPTFITFRYLPTAGFGLGLPLSLLPPRIALGVWWIINEFLMILCARAAWRETRS